jgi:hypothetical protein
MILAFDGDETACQHCGDASATIWLAHSLEAVCADCAARSIERALQSVCDREAATYARLEAKIEEHADRLAAVAEELSRANKRARRYRSAMFVAMNATRPCRATLVNIALHAALDCLREMISEHKAAPEVSSPFPPLDEALIARLSRQILPGAEDLDV